MFPFTFETVQLNFGELICYQSQSMPSLGYTQHHQNWQVVSTLVASGVANESVVQGRDQNDIPEMTSQWYFGFLDLFGHNLW